MAKGQIIAKKSLLTHDLLFPAIIWLCSRLLIWIAMLAIAPNLSAPPGGITPTLDWGVFDAWDSEKYRQIITSGYEYVNDGKGHNIAFFPLFPLIIRGLMSLGLPFEVAGTVISNVAFLAALYCIYFWVKQQHNQNGARWATIVMAWFPSSIFTAVIYTEGLYLFLSTATLYAFDSRRYGWTALCGALATATRPTGIVIIPALAIASWKQRRPPIAYMAALATAGGLILFSIFCAIKFGEPLAFINAQKGWRPSFGFDWQGWWKMLMQITIGSVNWKHGGIKDPLPPILFIIIAAIGYCLWYFRKSLGAVKRDYSFGALVLLFWIVAGDPLINTVTILGGTYLLWHLRHKLTPANFMYGCLGIGLLLASGGTISLSRLTYGITSLSVALGLLLSENLRWAYQTLFFFTILLVAFSLRFAQNQWVG